MIAFSRAVTGLRIAEQNLYVTSNNLSNVENESYHRQRLSQYSFQTTSRGNFAIGLGVDADTVTQTRLEYLETNYRNELASYGEYKYEDKVYTSLQAIIGDDGSYLQDTLQDMWESFNELAKEYTTTIAGGYLRENAISLIAEFDGINDQLYKMQNELDTEVKNVVREINDYAEQIAILNDKITRSEGDGSLACELRDSRDSIIASLSELVDITVENSTDTCVDIRTSNGYLVVRTHSNKIATDNIVSGSTFCSPVWEATGLPFEVESGELKGILDMRGGNVIGNVEHSSNGAAKEKMDIVVSIDTDMDYSSVESMMSGLKDMFNTYDRQGVNYELYLTNGKKVTADQLKGFAGALYAEVAKKELGNCASTKMSDLLNEISGLYGCDSKLSADVWEYIDNNTNFADFKTKLLDSIPDTEVDLIDAVNGYNGLSISEFNSYVESLEDGEIKDTLKENVAKFLDGEAPFDANGLFDKDAINDFLDIKYDVANVPADIADSNSGNVLWNIERATNIEFRDDSNPYLLVFTDDDVKNSAIRDEAAAKMKEVNMHLLAVTDEDSKTSWAELVEETDGSVLEITQLGTEEGAESVGLAMTRDFNSRLIGVEEENGIAYFRSGLNSLINALTREINGILRQGISGNGKSHGQEYIDPETGETKEYNLDLFIKIDDKLPLQMGNIQINPLYEDVMNMPLSLSGDTGDFRIGNMLVDLTTTDVFSNKDGYSTFDEHYADFILNFGQAANRALTGYETQETVLNTAKDRIFEVSGVSMDEELSNMVKFQYSYTAASKMIRVIDEMLETVISM